MLYLVAALFAISVSLLIAALVGMAQSRPRVIGRRLAELSTGPGEVADTLMRRRRQRQREKFAALLQEMGQRVVTQQDTGVMGRLLVTAGFRRDNAVMVFWGARILLTLGLSLGALLGMPIFRVPFAFVLLAVVWFGLLGWTAPLLYVRRRASARKREIQKALPDSVDLMVVCVEAGLGLNQALLRVSDEIRHVSHVMSDELALVNFEIRAGRPREDALRGLAERTGVDDIRSLVTMLVQTDRFGTSVATALRVHSDTMRTKRRQRTEEAAAKTTIKLVFPLVLFIFPAMFVVILGSAMIQIFKTLGRF